MRDDVALDAVIRQRPLLLEKLRKLVNVHTGYKGLEVTKDGIWCETKEGEKVLVPGSTVVCALGQRPRWNVAEELYDCAHWVRVIGDANAVGTITKATPAARLFFRSEWMTALVKCQCRSVPAFLLYLTRC